MKEEIVKRRYEALLQMVLDINGTGARTREKTDDKPTAFFWFNGHCGNATITLNKKGWYSRSDEEIEKEPIPPDEIVLDVDCRRDKQYKNACKVLSEFIEEMGGEENDK